MRRLEAKGDFFKTELTVIAISQLKDKGVLAKNPVYQVAANRCVAVMS